jgi:hypothetical protein
VAPLFPSHLIISKDDKGENIVGVALEEDEVAIIPASDGRCGDNHRNESCIASNISKKRKDGDYNVLYASMCTSTHLATLTATIDKRKSSREGSKKTKIIQQRKQLPDYNNDETLPSLAPFELFCKRNTLANIVDIVTGAAFARQG